jgi:Family of unknown function (DUF5641)
MKSILRKHLHKKTLNQDDFEVLLKKIEIIMKDRLLVPAIEDPKEQTWLTPSHFLIGRPVRKVGPKTKIKAESTLNWDSIIVCKRELRNKWKQVYIQTLHERKKWANSGTNLQVGDLVWIKEENQNTSQWPIARILEPPKGKNNLSGIAILRTRSTTLTRPWCKLIPFPRFPDNVSIN